MTARPEERPEARAWVKQQLLELAPTLDLGPTAEHRERQRSFLGALIDLRDEWEPAEEPRQKLAARTRSTRASLVAFYPTVGQSGSTTQAWAPAALRQVAGVVCESTRA